MAIQFVKKSVRRRMAGIGASGTAFLMFTTGLCAQMVVGGITPSLRPAGAPQIENITRDKTWFRHALTGVSMPHPPSLRFLENQGEWHTPFNRAGMTGPYDIRRWHQSSR